MLALLRQLSSTNRRGGWGTTGLPLTPPGSSLGQRLYENLIGEVVESKSRNILDS
jgi:hypothetical protein